MSEQIGKMREAPEGQEGWEVVLDNAERKVHSEDVVIKNGLK